MFLPKWDTSGPTISVPVSVHGGRGSAAISQQASAHRKPKGMKRGEFKKEYDLIIIRGG